MGVLSILSLENSLLLALVLFDLIGISLLFIAEFISAVFYLTILMPDIASFAAEFLIGVLEPFALEFNMRLVLSAHV